MHVSEISARRRRHVGRLSIVALAAAVALGVGAATAPAADYVALGDSYSAGSLVLPQDLSSPLCQRSQVNYPKLAAQALGLSLTDVTCGGATTGHMTTSQWPGVAPQFDALSAGTDVVTVGIGGNDGNLFAGSVAACGAISIAYPLTVVDIGAPCRDLTRATFFAQVDAIGPRIAAVVQGVHSRSPNAKVLVVGYPDILPQSGRCYPTFPITTGDTAFLNQIERRLIGVMQAAAEANDATFVDLFGPSIGHDACKSPDVRWVDPIIPSVWDGSITPIHPNRRGEAAMSLEVTAALQAAGF